MESNQILALFNKVIRKVVAYLKQVEKQRYVKVNQIEEPNEYVLSQIQYLHL